MIRFENFSSYENVLHLLCGMRIKIAHSRNKNHLIHLHTEDPKHNYHLYKPTATEKLICTLFPPRKKWKKPSFKNRMNNGISRNTSEKNMASLKMTILYYTQKHPDEPFLINLNNFIRKIQESIHIDNYKIGKPKIIPILKQEIQSSTKPNICRPIASYNLNDKIILSITNRYLTTILDDKFCDESFAFRSKRNLKDIYRAPNHHDPVQEILNYQKRFKAGSLWVSECDMKKFFDTVNHSVIKKSLRKFFNKKLFDTYNKNDLLNAKRILYDYLDSYTFNRNVRPLNQRYFDRFKISHGEFGWVGQELIENGYYKTLRSTKIGIPQGGALSGLIANIVLHDIDKEVLKYQDGSLLYVRFCDDMLIIHPKKDICKKTFNKYLAGLRSKKLVPHFHVKPPFSDSKQFWNEKSKKCYKWSLDYRKGSPWIGFVGYEIHLNGHLRVRKSSLNKEMKKQFKVVGDLTRIWRNSHCRSPNGVIYESVANRLIGMSVGRVNLWNYKCFKNEMCWVSGYKLLNDNKFSRIQLQRLDSSRNKLLRDFKNKMDKSAQKNTDMRLPSKSLQKIYYGKPFSYYHQFISKKGV